MTIAILRKTPGQQIPRPFNRADDIDEAAFLTPGMPTAKGTEIIRQRLDREIAYSNNFGDFYFFTEGR